MCILEMLAHSAGTVTYWLFWDSLAWLSFHVLLLPGPVFTVMLSRLFTTWGCLVLWRRVVLWRLAAVQMALSRTDTQTLRNGDNLLQECTAWQPRRPLSTYLYPWEPQISCKLSSQFRETSKRSLDLRGPFKTCFRTFLFQQKFYKTTECWSIDAYMHYLQKPFFFLA